MSGAKYFLDGKICVKMLTVVKLRVIKGFFFLFVHFPNFIYELGLSVVNLVVQNIPIIYFDYVSVIWSRLTLWGQCVSVHMWSEVE